MFSCFFFFLEVAYHFNPSLNCFPLHQTKKHKPRACKDNSGIVCDKWASEKIFMGQIRQSCSICYSHSCTYLVARFLCPFLKENDFRGKVMLYSLMNISGNLNVSCQNLLKLSGVTLLRVSQDWLKSPFQTIGEVSWKPLVVWAWKWGKAYIYPTQLWVSSSTEFPVHVTKWPVAVPLCPASTCPQGLANARLCAANLFQMWGSNRRDHKTYFVGQIERMKCCNWKTTYRRTQKQ